MMSDFERDYTIAYHWSPSTRRESIARSGLVIGSEPCINGVGGDSHRNGWISVSPTPTQAWWLSVDAILIGGFTPESRVWDLYEVDIQGLEVERRSDDYPEIRVLQHIAGDRVCAVALREVPDVVTNKRGEPM